MVQVQNLSFGYSREKLLYNDLSLTLSKGKIYGLLGKNGAGKSTFLKNLSGLLFPTKGEIFISGQEPRKRQPSFLRNIYFIPEEVYVPAVTITRYVQLFAPFYPNFSREQLNQYLAIFEVNPDSKLKSLSFGQQKKYVIAFALACNTDLLLLDEPTNGLDIPSKAQFRRLIASVISDNRIILISTHQTRDLENLIDNVMILDNGNLMLNSSVTDICRTLSFRIVPELPENQLVLFSEPALGGFAIVTENLEKEEEQMNLEHLFNAVMHQPAGIMKLFKPEKMNP
jgi:ABC-2 type transport system ATP-binding protein